MVGQKSVFWQALVFTIAVFGIGLMFGYFLESYRADRSEITLMNSEINLLDDQIRGEFIGSSNISCELAKASTFSFADKIYEDAMQLEKYDSANKFNRENLRVIHKRYDLLRMMLWAESTSLKNKCRGFHTLVYFFNYDPQDVDLRAKQAYYSRMLTDLKSKYPDEILLIPVAANMDLASVNIATESYKIESPAILIDEKNRVDEIITFEELEDLVFGK